jgi:pilus assembly protein Flp/PilA
MFNKIKRLMTDEKGATLVEYGLLVALVAVACIVAVTFFSTQIQAVFNSTGNKLQAAG